MTFRITAISFSLSSILSALIAWRTFLVCRKQRENQASKFFFYALVGMSFYMGVRAIVSLFFLDFPSIMVGGYILSHVFLGAGASFLGSFSAASIFSQQFAKKIFALILTLFASDVILNILNPNRPPYLNPELSIIEWGTNKSVGIYHTALLWLVFLTVGALFVYKAVKNWKDREVRTRSLIISLGVLVSIIVVIPRNIFHEPAFVLISDVGFISSFALVLWGISRQIADKKSA
jgi:hypothetical protein